MKQFKKIISLAFVMVALLVAMTGCSKYNFYSTWSEAGAEIEKDHIFEVLTLEEVAEKIENDETFALLYATADSQPSVKVVTTLQIQAEYLNATDMTIYFLDATDYISSSKKRKEIRETINMNDPMDELTDSPVIITYKKGVVDIDTSNSNDTKSKKFFEGTTVQYNSLASYIFRELLAE